MKPTPRRALLRTAAFLLAVSAALLASRIDAQQNACADCHFADPQGAPGGSHLYAWQSSAHGRADIACSECHGGDPTTYDAFRAHRDVLSSSNPSSPTHWRNLPRTCGRCHPAALAEFGKSRHSELLAAGERAPTCATCHGPAAAFLLSSKGLARTCRECHREGRPAGHPEHPEIARELHDRVVAVRDLLKAARRLIRETDDPARREELDRAYAEAEAPLREAVVRAHSFRFEGSEGLLDDADEKAHELLRQVTRGG